MTDTPLYSALVAFAEENRARFHMPGHKGTPSGCKLDGAFAIDYTEIPQTGNLYLEDGPIAEAEALAARWYGMGSCVFLTCGATQGIKAMLASACPMGGKILADRNCHKSVWDACALLQIEPDYLCPETIEAYGITGGLDAEELEARLQTGGYAALLVTSPTYYGYCMDLKPIAEAAHRHGAKLLVDAAHGSHLRACGLEDAAFQGADSVVFSAHKTLRALTQGAYLLTRTREEGKTMRANAALFGTSSPSYPIMASLDLARAEMESGSYAAFAKRCRAFRRMIEENTPFPVPDLGDPCRLSIFTACAGLSGEEAAQRLRKRGIEPEMADCNSVVCIATPADESENLFRLEKALLALAREEKAGPSCVVSAGRLLPEKAMTVREACFSPWEELPLCDCAGKTAAQGIAPYPPGVPVIAPGEKIHQNFIEYLGKRRYNISNKVKVVKEA